MLEEWVLSISWMYASGCVGRIESRKAKVKKRVEK